AGRGPRRRVRRVGGGARPAPTPGPALKVLQAIGPAKSGPMAARPAPPAPLSLARWRTPPDPVPPRSGTPRPPDRRCAPATAARRPRTLPAAPAPAPPLLAARAARPGAP